MGYVIAAIVVVLLVAGLLVFVVGNATRKSNVSDETALGDTNQVSPRDEGGRQESDPRDVARPVVGGEGEGERSAL